MKAMERTPTDPILVFSILCHDFGKALTPKEIYPHHYSHDTNGVEPVKVLCKRLKVPKKYERSAFLTVRYHMTLSRLPEMRPGKAVNLLRKLDGFEPDGINGFLKIIQADSGEDTDKLEEFIEKVLSSIRVKLPEEFWNMGVKSTEKLNDLMIKKYVELKMRGEL